MGGGTRRSLMAGLAAAGLVASTPPAHAIVNGTEVTSPEQFPYAVQVQAIESDNESDCAGTLVSDRYVATAAHCVRPDARMVVRMGGVDRKEVLDDQDDPRIHQVKRSIAHPDYKPGRNERNDIALLELADLVTFGSDVLPARLPSSAEIRRDYGTFLVAGWGKLGNDEPEPDGLTFFEETQSQHCYKSSKVSERAHLCGDPGDDKGICSGDGGGPAIEVVDEVHYLIGIPSVRSNACDGKVDYYTRVSTYLEWITQYTGPQPESAGVPGEG